MQGKRMEQGRFPRRGLLSGTVRTAVESRVKAEGIFRGSTEKEPIIMEDEVLEVLCVSKGAQLKGG